MKPNTKSKYFKLSLMSAGLFLIHLLILGLFIKSAVKHDHPASTFVQLSWVAIVWISLAAVFYYKTTQFRQALLRQIAVFFLAPIVLSPILAVLYVVIVLLPIYSLANQNGFSN